MLCLSEEILSELRDAVQRPKFGFPATIANEIISELAAIGELVLPPKEISEIKVDPADNRVLECAAEARADYVVSADSHLLDLGEYASIRIVSPYEFLDLHG